MTALTSEQHGLIDAAHAKVLWWLRGDVYQLAGVELDVYNSRLVGNLIGAGLLALPDGPPLRPVLVVPTAAGLDVLAQVRS
ncbi:hypothetical protein AB0F72_08760 [Actinoplanes sp. NPDC023936]|uniref:hypothetical protein n=1 Tax=Actinoplanes sp. NPDC023936 TaxID=3154910 RepID=UPI003402B361